MSIKAESRGGNPDAAVQSQNHPTPPLPSVCKLAANVRTKKTGAPKNPRPGAELPYGVGSAYDPPKMSELPKLRGQTC